MKARRKGKMKMREKNYGYNLSDLVFLLGMNTKYLYFAEQMYGGEYV